MERIAYISGGTFLYWSAVVMGLAAVAAIGVFLALYLRKSGNGTAAFLMVPMGIVFSLILGRLFHWYCRVDSYESFAAAMTDYSEGGYALMGAFAACALCAGVLRLTKIVKNLPELLDCLALSGGAGIAVGRMASVFNASDRGMPVGEALGMPVACPVTNPVSGAVENRLATFMLQAMVTAVIVLALVVYQAICRRKQKQIKDGDICLLFLAAYGGSQVVLDSTRYDSLFLRSNGFVSVVQILGAVALVAVAVSFSVRMVKKRGLAPGFFGIWAGILVALAGAGYMEYHVQRHGDQALFAYSVMGVCVLAVLALTVLSRGIAQRNE